MADKSKKENKNLIVGGICAVVAIVVVVIIAVVVATTGSGKLGDSYFVSDGEKYVLTLDTEDMELGETDNEYVPTKAHIVYYYSGDEITSAKAYYEYKDAETAKAALAEMKEQSGEDLGDAAVDGKYIVVTVDASEYEGMTASDVKSQIEFMEALKNMDFSEDEVEVVEETDTTNDTEEVTE